jgi:alcohol dehydrogenase class IV
MHNTVWQFATASTLKFGRGARHTLLEQLARVGCRRPLVVTDTTVASTIPVAQLLSQLRAASDLLLFDQCTPEPAICVAEAACTAAAGQGVDGVVGIGGGSNLDVAKVVATVLRHGGGPADYFGFDRIPGPVLPLFALPTTAGTGSEVSHSAVLTDTQRQIKVSTLSNWLRPWCALVDPALTDSCPSRVAAHSGIDALVHAVEAYTNRNYTEMSDRDPQARAYEGSYPLTQLLAAEAIRLIGGALQPVCQDRSDLVARDDMALAATLAGMAFSNSGVAIVHALEYPIGALTHCGHGEGNGLLLPHVMRFNLPAREQHFAKIAGYLGLNTAGMELSQAAEQAIVAVEQLLDAIGITRRLRDLGLAQQAIPDVARKAFEIKRLMDVNPRSPSLEDLQSILLAAY